MPRSPGRIAHAEASPLHVILEVVPLSAELSGTGTPKPGRRVPLVPDEARELAAELLAAADELEGAAGDAVRAELAPTRVDVDAEIDRAILALGATAGRIGTAGWPKLVDRLWEQLMRLVRSDPATAAAARGLGGPLDS